MVKDLEEIASKHYKPRIIKIREGPLLPPPIKSNGFIEGGIIYPLLH
jgi:hypothetical protein